VNGTLGIVFCITKRERTINMQSITDSVKKKPMRKIRLITVSKTDPGNIVLKTVRAHDCGSNLLIAFHQDVHQFEYARLIIDIDGYGRDVGSIQFPALRTWDYLLKLCSGMARTKTDVIRELETRIQDGKFISKMDILLSELVFPAWTARLKAARKAYDEARAGNKENERRKCQEEETANAKAEADELTSRFLHGGPVESRELIALLVWHIPDEYAGLPPIAKANLGKTIVRVREDNGKICMTGTPQNWSQKDYGKLLIGLVSRLQGGVEIGII
jgi:hypothetical protein